MKEDYLWDKTGLDPQIEALEHALRPFGHTQSEPPRLPVRMPATAENVRPLWFRLGFAVAFASMLVAATLFTFWFFKTSTLGSSVAVAVKATGQRQLFDQQPTTNEDDSRSQVASLLERPLRRSFRPTAIRSTGREATSIRKGPKALTEKERYAFNQLMLALSITSSKLKIVHDAISGDEQNARNKDSNQK